ncbi:extracellular solute-binding protein [Candidatus Daviesbacteria bacterium]|nr:extracellular solute-binding protein [Candidatus Daviesbacteria bacterium]
MKIIIIVVLVISVILGILFWRFGYLLKGTSNLNQPVTLKVWGLWEDESLIKGAIDLYQKRNPSVTVEYTHQSSVNYRTRVQTQILQSENGPDILMIHNSWVPMFLQKSTIAAIPLDLMSIDQFKKTFYPIATDNFIKNNQIYALPLEVDGLALFYNEDLLSQKNIKIPQNWDEFMDAASKLTVKDEKSNIQIAGAAMGTTSNVDHWSDIVGLLFSQQPNANLEKPATKAGADVLRFYTSFIKNEDPAKRVWSVAMEGSTQAFFSGKLAFYFAPSWRAHELRVANPELNFKTAPVPHLPGRNIGWATYWALAVSNKSSNQKKAWEFLNFLTSKEVEKLLYQEASRTRLFGQPYSRVDLQKEIINDPIAGAFVAQAPTFKSWYLASRTFDQGINDEMIKYYEDAINATLEGRDPLNALQTTEQGVKQVLDKYINPLPAPSEE